MGEIVWAGAAAHAPQITGSPEIGGEQATRFYAGMEELHKSFVAAQPDIVIEILNEHFVNFYLDNMPAICIGVSDSHFGPVGARFLRLEERVFPGNAELAKSLVRESHNSGFEVSFSEDLAFDSGAIVPLHSITPGWDVPVVPVLTNNIAEPMPLPWRVYQLGKVIQKVVEARPKGERIAILGTGGISDWVGTPQMGMINVDFDEKFLDLIEKGDNKAISDWTPEEIGKGGNGAHEIRNWIGVMGCLPNPESRGKVAAYEPIVSWVTGCAAVTWDV
jgi:protocatechuate 4,5-dioxygenase beta chain/2,3-dihydroxyphenylpropionate 1,2-dioxygenase